MAARPVVVHEVAGSAAVAAPPHGFGGAAPLAFRAMARDWRDLSVVSEGHETREAHGGHARPPMEDKVGGFEADFEGVRYTCLYVIDGHGGVETAQFVRDNFRRVFVSKLSSDRTTGGTIHATFDEIEFELRARRVPAGAVAAFVVLRVKPTGERKLFVANVGDVEVVLHDGAARPVALLTTRHSLRNRDELERVARLSGNLATLVDGNYMAVGGFRVANTRAFGDFEFLPMITAEPAMLAIDPAPARGAGSFLIIASDGVFDYLGPAEAVAAVHAHGLAGRSRVDAAQALLLAAQPARGAGLEGRRDNASAIVAFF